MIKVGDYYELERSFGEEEVKKFADLSNDHNPLHLDPDYAKKTFFGERIVHGMLYSSMISAILANHLPGPGTIYMEQKLRFAAPVFYNEVLIARVEVHDMDNERKIAFLTTSIKKQSNDQIVIDGKAKVKVG
ncbi:MAG: enoyl-CoA hydratase [Balneola sp.]|nr:enoyl-CoA hydratase [Balneola sp.]|tara:strand:- start:24835 stop:25230 length:396 start_codon:yes stop_codon:yes gene_type:complete